MIEIETKDLTNSYKSNIYELLAIDFLTVSWEKIQKITFTVT